ncbi:hypothetical protein J6590_088566 [Homalodisca vitripennis]|nr:hypothetical protein J6590_088566 [Homalodisca vitripennis]
MAKVLGMCLLLNLGEGFWVLICYVFLEEVETSSVPTSPAKAGRARTFDSYGTPPTLVISRSRPIELPLHPNMLTLAVSAVTLLDIHKAGSSGGDLVKNIVLPDFNYCAVMINNMTVDHPNKIQYAQNIVADNNRNIDKRDRFVVKIRAYPLRVRREWWVGGSCGHT